MASGRAGGRKGPQRGLKSSWRREGRGAAMGWTPAVAAGYQALGFDRYVPRNTTRASTAFTPRPEGSTISGLMSNSAKCPSRCMARCDTRTRVSASAATRVHQRRRAGPGTTAGSAAAFGGMTISALRSIILDPLMACPPAVRSRPAPRGSVRHPASQEKAAGAAPVRDRRHRRRSAGSVRTEAASPTRHAHWCRDRWRSPACKFAGNSDPLRGGFRVQSRPL